MGAVIVLQWLPPSHPLPSRSYDIDELNFKWLHPSRIRSRLYSSKKWKEREKEERKKRHVAHSVTLLGCSFFHSRGKLAGEQVKWAWNTFKRINKLVLFRSFVSRNRLIVTVKLFNRQPVWILSIIAYLKIIISSNNSNEIVDQWDKYLWYQVAARCRRGGNDQAIFHEIPRGCRNRPYSCNCGSARVNVINAQTRNTWL